MNAARACLALLLAGAIVSPAGADQTEAMEAYARGEFEHAWSAWKPLAEDGDPTAQANLGLLYLLGQGVERDSHEALRWIRAAAEQGNPIAQDNLGQLYHLGQGVERDDGMAAEWIRRAAEQDDPHAQLRLGILYERGAGVERDLDLALYWFERAASGGEARAIRERDRVLGGIAPVDSSASSATPREEGAPGAGSKPSLPPAPIAPRTPELRAPAAPDPDLPTVDAAPVVVADARPSSARDRRARLQLSAVRSRARAQSELQRIERSFPMLVSEVSLAVHEADLGRRGVFYRVRTEPLDDAARADALCGHLRQRKQSCWVVAPR